MSDFQVKEIVEEALRCGQSHKNNGGGCALLCVAAAVVRNIRS